MINLLTHNAFTKFFWSALALYLLNISVDTPDLTSNLIPEDLSINDQESFVEIILEEILGYEDAIPEFDDPDTDDPESQKKGSSPTIDPYTTQSTAKISLPLFTAPKNSFPDITKLTRDGHYQLDTPPPQA